MTHLTDDQLAQLRQQMQQRVASLIDYHENVEESDPANQLDRNQYNESGDDAVENYEMLESDTLIATAEDMISELKEALQRMDDGSYGIDEVTGDPIPFARLELFPEARTNVDTDSDLE